ncbi:hypothetical protein YB2330_002024 [Saitoella coloradoensis]
MSAENDDFTYVTHKKPYRNKKGRKVYPKPPRRQLESDNANEYRPAPTDNLPLEEHVKRFEQKAEELRTSDFWKEFKSMITNLLNLKSPSTSDSDPESPPPTSSLPRNIQRFIILGLGSPTTSPTATYQLAFALEFYDILNAYASGVEGMIPIRAYDPVFNAQDRALLGYYKVSTPPTGGGDGFEFDVGVRTVWFMPHCPTGLYEKLCRGMVESTSPSVAGNVILLGNNLKMYPEAKTKEEMASTYPSIQRVTEEGLEIRRLPTSFDRNNVFNDICLQWDWKIQKEVPASIEHEADGKASPVEQDEEEDEISAKIESLAL